jgi:ATP-dependent 26S proteasome regulatory subunit
MPATSTSIESLTRLNEAVRLAADPDGPPPRDLAHAIGEHRSRMADHAEAIDSALVISIRHLANGLKQSEARIAELAGIVSDLASDPWPAAIYLRSVGRDHEGTPSRAEVLATGNRRVVLGIDRSRVDPSTLVPGQKVYLNAKGSAIMMAESSDAGEATGDTAVFVRWLDPETRRRLIVRQHNDEEVIAEAACPPDELEALKPGNRVRFLREAQIVCERIPDPAASEGIEFSTARRTRATRADIGGQSAAYEQLEMTVFGALIDPSRAARYGLNGRKVVLLSGPPGTGKTLLAKVVATEMEERFQRPCHFASVKPAEWDDPYVGGTQEKIRRFFENCRRLAEDGLVVAYIDEVEAIGRHRGSGETAHHSDRALAAFLAEVDGTEACPNLCIICATNRKDLLDTALTSRISVEIHVGRPDAKGAREIFGIHLRPAYTYSPNGSESEATRNEAIERANALLFGKGEESEIAHIRFADAKSRTVRASSLVSGRLIQQIAEAACQRAFTRDLKNGDPGIRREDVEAGVAEAFAKMRSSLTRHSIHAYLEDLPQDVAVVAVEPIVPKVPDRHRYRVHA